MGLDQQITVGYKDYNEKQYTYRKVNFLRGYLIKNTDLTEESNTETVDVSIEIIKKLYKKCNDVLENKVLAEDELPVKVGPFFGTHDYGEWYFEDVEEVKNDLEEILANEDEIDYITYWDWW